MFDLLKLIRLTDRDKNSPLIQHYSDGYAATANLATIATAHLKIPIDRILIITSWHVIGNDGLVAGDEYCRFYSETFTGVYENIETAMLPPNASGPIPSYLDFNIIKEHVIMGGDAPYAELIYAAPNVANSIESRVRGFLIPKGTMTGF